MRYLPATRCPVGSSPLPKSEDCSPVIVEDFDDTRVDRAAQ